MSLEDALKSAEEIHANMHIHILTEWALLHRVIYRESAKQEALI